MNNLPFKDFPIPEAFLPPTTQPIVLLETNFLTNPQAYLIYELKFFSNKFYQKI